MRRRKALVDACYDCVEMGKNLFGFGTERSVIVAFVEQHSPPDGGAAPVRSRNGVHRSCCCHRNPAEQR